MRFLICCLSGLSVLMSSCIVIHSGGVSSGPLVERTDKYVDLAVGRAKSVFVFGFGDLSNDDLVLKAKNDLHMNRPLTNEEYYSNVSTSITNKFVLLFIHTTKVTVSADVLQARDTSAEKFSSKFRRLTGSEVYLRKKSSEPDKPLVRNSSILILRDTVYFSKDQKDFKRFEVLMFDQGSILLKGLDAETKNTLVPANSSFFICNIEIDGFKSGSNVSFEYEDEALNKVAGEGTVLGVSENYALVQTKLGNSVHPISKLKKK